VASVPNTSPAHPRTTLNAFLSKPIVKCHSDTWTRGRRGCIASLVKYTRGPMAGTCHLRHQCSPGTRISSPKHMMGVLGRYPAAHLTNVAHNRSRRTRPAGTIGTTRPVYTTPRTTCRTIASDDAYAPLTLSQTPNSTAMTTLALPTRLSSHPPPRCPTLPLPKLPSVCCHSEIVTAKG
jgi:hypothetical protein